ncbi:MAG: tRNA uridine-5-carboxymethylaminomethyl(34) synthesis GTPase MnmE [Myxococcales bacterium]|nr:tRNA uridine-5-carboxymethylaminomethyl(34) synthesis GTPase MnmE [Myxococcales bacterium]
MIVAAATPHGHSALALVRLTGRGLDEVLRQVLRGHHTARPWEDVGRARRVDVVGSDGQAIDDGLATVFRGPATATGEDVCEVTVHGNPLLVQLVVQRFVEAGARPAQPGEFTRRAVMQGRLDLLSAEAVDQVIRATSPGGLRLGRAGLSGVLARRVDATRQRIVDVVAELEARLDYPADELALENDVALCEALHAVGDALRSLGESHRAGQALVDGVRVALVGPVNAGKSSLFNRLVGRPRALVHATPGTTRDVVEARCRVGPLEITLLDTAGERSTDDPVEAAGVALGQELVDDSDVILVVLRAGPHAVDDVERELLERTVERRRLVVYNGVDRPHATPPEGALCTSAVTGEGLEALQKALVRAAGVGSMGDELLVASARQRDLLLRVAAACDAAVEAMDVAGVAVSADLLTEALGFIDELTGADTREDVLDAVFARFCIGK